MTIEKWKYLQARSITLDMIFLLDHVSKNPKVDLFAYFETDPKLTGIVKTLIRKNLVAQTFEILEDGKAILDFVNDFSKQEIQNKNESFAEWVYSVHALLQALLKKLTGKIQKTDKIKGTSYSFLCNPKDLHDKLLKVNTIYGPLDRVKAQKVLSAYVIKCYKENSWFPVIEYYIEKEGKSRFYTDYLDFEEVTEIEDKPKETKNLF